MRIYTKELGMSGRLGVLKQFESRLLPLFVNRTRKVAG